MYFCAGTGTNGTGAVLVATLSGGGVASVAVISGGTGYGLPPGFHIEILFGGGGPGSGAAATATVSGGGAITAITMTASGSGYTSAPLVIPVASLTPYATYASLMTYHSVGPVWHYDPDPVEASLDCTGLLQATLAGSFTSFIGHDCTALFIAANFRNDGENTVFSVVTVTGPAC